MHLRNLLIWSLATLATGIHAFSTDDDFQLRQLTEDNFRKETARGLWLVEHFSPKCAHCRAFAPTWTQLAEDKQHLERLTGFHMAQVNCLAQGDLCNTNGIKFYPQLILYADGKPLPAYAGDRSHADLSKYIEEQSTAYARGLLRSDEHDGGNHHTGGVEEMVMTGFGRPNPEGKVLEVDELGLKGLTDSGQAVLVDYFAPWCGHCKKLKPIYEKLAEALKGKLHIVSVDCERYKTFCRKQQITGYPTIRLLHHGSSTDYAGPRSLDKMREFADKAMEATALRPIMLEDWADVVRSDEAFFLYLQTFDTDASDLDSVKETLEPLVHSIPAYTSSDPLLYKNLSISNPPPTSLLLAFSSFVPTPVATLSFPTTHEALNRFVNLHRFPTAVGLSAANYREIMKGPLKAIVVLGAIHRGDEGEKEKKAFMEIARAWKKGGRDFNQPVWFAWVEGEKWSGWLKQSYGIKKKRLPAVVVADPSANHQVMEYYDTTIEGTKIAFEGASVFSVLEGVYQHFLRPKKSETTLEWGSRSATMTLIQMGQMSVDHPFLALVILVGAVVGFVFFLQRCVARDLRGEGFGSSARLD